MFKLPRCDVCKVTLKVTCPDVVGCLKMKSRWCYGQIGTGVWTGWSACAVTFVVTAPRAAAITFAIPYSSDISDGARQKCQTQKRGRTLSFDDETLGTWNFEGKRLLLAPRMGRSLREELGV
jgi:hypothetical protein